MRSRPTTTGGSTPLNMTAARVKVAEYLDSLPPIGLGRRVIQSVENHELFWLFWWYPAWCRNGVGGNCPIAVCKASGRLYVLGPRVRKEEFAEQIRRGELTPVDSPNGDSAAHGAVDRLHQRPCL